MISMIDMITSNKSVVYLFKSRNEKVYPYPHRNVGIKRIVWPEAHSNKAVVLLESILDNDLFLKNYITGYSPIHVRYYECGSLDNPSGGRLLAVMDNCRLKRSWINNLSSVEYSAELVTYHVEIECDFYWLG